VLRDDFRSLVNNAHAAIINTVVKVRI